MGRGRRGDVATPGACDWAAGCLRDAARRALSGGAPDSAITLLQRLLREPLSESDRVDGVIALSQAESAAGRPPGPGLREALAAVDDPVRRGRMLGAMGWGLHRAGRFALATAAFADARRQIAGVDEPELDQELQAGELAAALLSAEHAPAAHAQIRELSTQPPVELTSHQRALLSAALTQQLFVGRPHEELRAAARQLDVASVIASQTADDHVVWHLIGLLSWTDAHEVESVLGTAFADAGARESVLAFAMASYARSWPRLWSGDLDGAAADAQAAIDAWAGGMEMYLPAATYWGVCALLERGDDSDATAVFDRLGAPARWDPAMAAFVHAARGRLAAERGDHAAALADHLDCGAIMTGGISAPNPTIIPWRSQAALAAAGIGDVDQARELAAEEVSFARDFGAPRALGVALAVHGQLTTSQDELEEAVTLLDADFTRLEHVRALIGLGGLLRRAGKRSTARETLETALTGAHRLGARRLHETARTELRSSGARPRHLTREGRDALTPSERRVAALAATGVSNREIAGQLFITVSTVEWHLRRTYVKLDVASRRDLPTDI